MLFIIHFISNHDLVNSTRKESFLDHVYVNNIAIVTNVTFKLQTFGDYVLAIIELNLKTNNENKLITKGEWHNFSTVLLNQSIALIFFCIRPLPGLLPVLGPLERYITPILDSALL